MYGIAHRLCVLFHTFVALFCIFKSMKERKKGMARLSFDASIKIHRSG